MPIVPDVPGLRAALLKQKERRRNRVRAPFLLRCCGGLGRLLLQRALRLGDDGRDLLHTRDRRGRERPPRPEHARLAGRRHGGRQPVVVAAVGLARPARLPLVPRRVALARPGCVSGLRLAAISGRGLRVPSSAWKASSTGRQGQCCSTHTAVLPTIG